MKTNIRVAIIASASLAAYTGALSVSTVPFVCKPYTPRPTCEHGIYEIKIYESNYVYMREPMAFLEAECIYDLGERYKAVEVWFHTPPARTEFIESAELPKKHIEICRVE